MSLSKNDIKFVKSLGLKKYRQNYNKFTVEGDKMVRELLAQSRFRVESLYALPEWHRNNQSWVNQAGLACTLLSEQQLGQLSQLTTPNQALAVVSMAPAEDLRLFSAQAWSLYLDGIQDPANLGAIFRVADWFGIHQVVLGPGTVDPYNSKAIQASMGAFLRVRWWEASLGEIAVLHPDLRFVGATMEGENVFLADLPAAGVLVIGREGPGISEATEALLHQVIAVPAPRAGGAESLNASVATGILCAAIIHRTTR